MRRYFLQLSYNGQAYNGWQRQPNGLGVQQVIEEALAQLYGQEIEITGSGRTDAGVHALDQWAHADLPERFGTEDLAYRLNKVLPKDIAIQSIRAVVADAHARFSASRRRYLYRILVGKDAFLPGQVTFLDFAPDLEHLRASSRYLLGQQDFQAFSKVHTDVSNYLCLVEEAQWNQIGRELHFTITANRFLRNMVRAIVGSSLDLARQQADPANMQHIIASQNRSQAGPSASADGLYLAQVSYPTELFLHG